MRKLLNASVIVTAMVLGFSHYSLADTLSITQDNNDENTVTVEWIQPKDFRDVRPSNESRTKFRERILENLEAHFKKYAEKLPDNHRLNIKVTDLDLAGRVMPASFAGFGAVGSDVRVIKDIDIPRITMSYELSDTNGEVLKSDSVMLKDVSFLQNSALRYRNQLLGYEKNMLDKWFKQTFVQR